MEFESKLSSVRVVGNKSDKQLSKIENFTKVTREGNNDYFKMIHKAAYDANFMKKDLKYLLPYKCFRDY